MKKHLLLLLAVFLSACGGGGGSSGGSNSGTTTLFVQASFPSKSIYLYHSGAVAMTSSGFSGHTPQCSSPSGLPPGMTIDSHTCIASGTPTATGSFYFTVHVTANEADGSVDASGVIDVPSPGIVYPGRDVVLGEQVNDVPYIGNWDASGSQSGTWTYAITSGAVPTGTTFNTSTGAITGIATTAGTYQVTVTGTLTSSLGTFTTSVVHGIGVSREDTFDYENDDVNAQNAANSAYLRSFVSVPFSASPAIPGGGTVTGFAMGNVPLPTGLTLDNTTGAISGTPVALNTRQTYPVTATYTITDLAYTYSIGANFMFETVDPLLVSYWPSHTGNVNVPLDVAPVITQVSPDPLPGATYQFQASTTVTSVTGNPPCNFPPGVTLDSQTGHFSGTPTTAGSYSCYVDITITNNGISWTRTQQFYVVISP